VPCTKAYKLFSEGKRPIQAALILKLQEAEVTKYYFENLRMTQLPELPQIFNELGKKGISVFLILTQKVLAENLKSDEVLKLANHKLPKLEGRIEKMQIFHVIV
jgi:predicted transcriptional regulator